MDTSLKAINAKIVETLNSVNANWSDDARDASQFARKQMGWPGLSQTWNRGSKGAPSKPTADTAEDNAKNEIDTLNDMPQGTNSSDPARKEWNDQFEKALDAIDKIPNEKEREQAKDALRDMENVTDIENFIDPRTGNELNESTNWKEEEDLGDSDPGSSTLLGQEIKVVGNNEYEIDINDLGYTISGLPESGVVKVNDPDGILGNLQKGDFVPDNDFDFEVKNGEVFITKDRFAEENLGDNDPEFQKMEQDFRGGDGDREFQREENQALIQQRKERQEAIEEQIEREDKNEQGSGDGNQEFQRRERESIEELNRNQQQAIEEQIEREESNRRSFEEAAAPGEIEKLSMLDLEEFESLANNPETKQKFADERAKRQETLSDRTTTDAETIASNPATLKELSVYEIAEFITESENPATRKILTDELDRRVAETNP